MAVHLGSASVRPHMLFVECLDAAMRDKALRYISTRQYAYVPQCARNVFGALIDDAGCTRQDPLVVASWEILGVPRELRGVVASLYRVLWSPTQPDADAANVVLLIDSDPNCAFEAALASGQRPDATLEDFYAMGREDATAVVDSIVPGATVVRVVPTSCDTLSMADLWEIDRALSEFVDSHRWTQVP